MSSFVLFVVKKQGCTKILQVGQTRHSVELGASPNQERAMRMLGLECLVSIIKCMVEWSKDLYINPNLQSTVGCEKERGRHHNGCGDDSVSLKSHGGSTGSLQSSDSGNKEVLDSPEQLEVLKQQKEVSLDTPDSYAPISV